jgi:hypothetical protein
MTTQTTQVYNVRAYGAVGDGVTDDTSAILAAQSALNASTPNSYTGGNLYKGVGVLYFPPGMYKISQTLKINRTCKFLGDSSYLGGSGYSASQLIFTTGVSGIEVDRKENSSDGYGGDYSVIEGLSIISVSPTTTPTVYSAWQANHAYTSGQIVRSTNDNRYFYKCTTPGTSGATEPSWVYRLNATRTDGGVTWTAFSHHGIYLQTPAEIRNCAISGFTNAGLLISGNGLVGPNVGFPDYWSAENVIISVCGVGVSADGSDSNAGKGKMISIYNAGSGIPGTGGFGIYDHSFLGCTWDTCNAQGCTGKGFIVDLPSAFSTVIGQYIEIDTPGPLFNHPAVVLGGDCFGAGGINTASTASIFQSQLNMRRIFDKDDTGSYQTYVELIGGSNTTYGMYSTDDPNYGMNFAYNKLGGSATGFWSYTWGPFGYLAGWSQSGSKAYLSSPAYGPGLMWIHKGFMSGGASYYNGNVDTTNAYYRGLSKWSMYDTNVKSGAVGIGDRYDVEAPAAAVGTWTGYIALTSGYRGQPWGANTAYYNTQTLPGVPAVTVEPTANGTPIPTAGSFVYQCSVTGTTSSTQPATVTTRWTATTVKALNNLVIPTHAHWVGYYFKATSIGSVPNQTGASEPTWPTTIGNTVVDGNITWTNMGTAWGQQSGESTVDGTVTWNWLGTVPTYAYQGFIDDPNTAITPQASTSWDGIVKSQITKAQTTTSTANQVLATYALPDNCGILIDVAISVRRVGASGTASIKLSGTYERNSAGNATLVGSLSTPVIQVNAGVNAGITASLVISTTSVQVQCSPGDANTYEWTIVRQGVEGYQS